MHRFLLSTFRDILQQLLLFITTPQGLGLTIIIGIVVIILIFITLISSKRNQLSTRISAIHLTLKAKDYSSIQEKLNRMKVIGQNNVVYQRAYEEQQSLFENLQFTHVPTLEKAIEGLKTQLEQKKFREVNKKIKEFDIQLNAYQEQLHMFELQISELIKQDEGLRQQESEIRAIFKEVRDQFATNQENLTLVEEELAEKMSNIHDKFELFEQQLNRGNYDDAQDYLRLLDKEVRKLSLVLQDLPRVCQIASKYFPPKVNRIIEDLNQMQKEGYPLYHIVAGAKVNKIKEDLLLSINKIRVFEFEKIDETFHAIDEKINELRGKIDEERNAKKEFDSNFLQLYTRAEDLEKAFIRYMGEINELNRIYDISKQASEFSGRIKQHVNQLSITRRALDSLNYSKQPYLMRYHKMQEMSQLAVDLEAMLANFKKEVTNMKVISEDAHDLVKEAATKLKILEIAIRNFRLDKLISKYSRDFQDGYELINKLNKAISTSPIHIKLVDDLKAKLDHLLHRMDEKVNRDVVFGNHCEQIIMYANNYRASFSDVESSVSKAELLFFDARFEEAVDLVTASIKKLGEVPFRKPTIERS